LGLPLHGPELKPPCGWLSAASAAARCGVAIERAPDRGLSGVRGGLAHGLVLHHARRELRLRLGHRGSSRTVNAVHPDEKKKVGEGSDAKSQCGYEHEHSDEYLAPGLCTRNLTDPKYEAARPSVSDADKVETTHEELKEEYEEEDHEVEGGVVTEGLVCGPEPTDERDRREEDKVEEPEPEGLAKVAASEQVEQADYHVREEQTNMRDPKVVKICDDFLELDRDVNIDVLVKARLERAEGWQRGPVVCARIVRCVPQLLFSPFKFLCASLQFFLATLKVSGGNLLLSRCGVLRWCRVHHGSCGVPRSDRRVVRGRFRLVKRVVVVEVRCG